MFVAPNVNYKFCIIVCQQEKSYLYMAEKTPSFYQLLFSVCILLSYPRVLLIRCRGELLPLVPGLLFAPAAPARKFVVYQGKIYVVPSIFNAANKNEFAYCSCILICCNIIATTNLAFLTIYYTNNMPKPYNLVKL